MSNESMPLPKRLRRTQEQIAFQEGSSRSSAILTRLIEEVAAPLDESSQQCQRLLESVGGKLTQEQRRTVEALAGNAASVARRIRDYIDLARLEVGDLPVQPKVLNLDDAILQVARQYKTAARGKGLDLVVEPAVKVLPPVLADPVRLGQVLSSLVANAVRFTERGRVTVSTELYDRSIAVHVVDTGVGIPAAQLPKLFEDFYQGDAGQSQSRDRQGSGLGLTLARRLVVRMGGDLWASSTVGAGSKFSFTVPRSPEAAGQARSVTA
jgi:signal transduction histidine kinase